MPDRATTATKAESANPRELTSRIEQHDLTANKELLDLKAKMSPKEYAQLLKHGRWPRKAMECLLWFNKEMIQCRSKSPRLA